jgi:hypothetical protein
VLALLDARLQHADIFAILDDGVALGQIDQRDLVPDWDVVLGGDGGVAVGFGDRAVHGGAGFEVLDDNHADVVLRAVDEKVRMIAFGQTAPLRAILSAT